ncbi:MAG: P-II family nitrogen regulator [Candidatus Methanomethylophilaceae archaeon]|nr:P-II family nitrogen regulator [Candidatus Methanomethylophilaceae archaeon]MBP5734669.1 P-II family nitrogen regulator [Candidatus Methanomethylophilaceae archaeon]
MKLITAVIRPEKCQAVKDALRDIGVNGMTITHVFGRGSQAGIKFITRAGDIIVDELEKTKIETVVDDEIVDKAIDAIIAAAQTGKPGDGRLIVTPVERFVRIRQEPEPSTE